MVHNLRFLFTPPFLPKLVLANSHPPASSFLIKQQLPTRNDEGHHVLPPRDVNHIFLNSCSPPSSAHRSPRLASIALIDRGEKEPRASCPEPISLGLLETDGFGIPGTQTCAFLFFFLVVLLRSSQDH